MASSQVKEYEEVGAQSADVEGEEDVEGEILLFSIFLIKKKIENSPKQKYNSS